MPHAASAPRPDPATPSFAAAAGVSAQAWRGLIATNLPIVAFRERAIDLGRATRAHPGLNRLVDVCLARDCPRGQIDLMAKACGASADDLDLLVRWCAEALDPTSPALAVNYVVGAINATAGRTRARLSSNAIASFAMIEPAAAIARLPETRRPSDFLKSVAATGLCDIETGLDPRSRAPSVERVVHPTWGALLTLFAKPQNDPRAPAPAIASIHFERLAGQTRTRIRPEFDWG